METRSATHDDLPAIRELVLAVAEEYGFPPEPEGADSDLFADVEQYFDERSLLRVLVENGAVVGMLGVVPRPEEVFELRKVYLAPAARGAGHGGRLLREALDHARALGGRKVILQSSTRLTEALGMYAKAGFRHVRAETRSNTCDVAMELDL